MGPRIREDTEGEVGWIPAPVFTGAGSPRIREDTEGEAGWMGSARPLSSRGQALRGKNR